MTPELAESMRRMKERMRQRKSDRQNFYIREHAVEIGELAPGVEYWIVENALSEDLRGMPPAFLERLRSLRDMIGALNGYVAFPKRTAPLKARSVGKSILTYLPVHGGVTYARKDALGMVYGFDTAHFNSGHLPVRDRAWIKWQCHVLYEAILKAAPIEPKYERAKTNEERADLVQPLLDMVPEQEYSFGVMLNMLSGEL